jgi:hypothetical protein
MGFGGIISKITGIFSFYLLFSFGSFHVPFFSYYPNKEFLFLVEIGCDFFFKLRE